MNQAATEELIAHKMRAAGVPQPTITAFLGAVRRVVAGDRGMLPESTIAPVQTLPALATMTAGPAADRETLRQLAVVKLNGGLGTSMGLDRTKSLIRVRGEDAFLDFIARQVLGLRPAGAREPAFYLMDSFVTRQETVAYLKKYPELSADGEVDFLQNMVPKLEAETLHPAHWPAQPDLEWCPPGHGDFYPSILGCGLLDRLLARGIRYAFISNADNLGATVDPKVLGYFAAAGLSFLMEVCERTAADRKGGHLAQRPSDGRLVLRESAQCPKADEGAFQDIGRHRFFNTNNLWVRLDHARAELARHGGALPLPLITNAKTVDPRDPKSPKVLQLESAMGAAIECFPRAGAIVVPRSRFAPVKTTGDLLALRSDAYAVTEAGRLALVAARQGQPPVVELDARYYKVLADFERLFDSGAPSLVACASLRVTGPVRFAAGVVCRGKVEFVNPTLTVRTAPAGVYSDQRVEVG